MSTSGRSTARRRPTTSRGSRPTRRGRAERQRTRSSWPPTRWWWWTVASWASRLMTRMRLACSGCCPGRSHEVLTGVAVRRAAQVAVAVESTAVHVRAAERRPTSPGTSPPASRATRRAPTPSRGWRRGSSSGSTGPTRTSSAFRSRCVVPDARPASTSAGRTAAQDPVPASPGSSIDPSGASGGILDGTSRERGYVEQGRQDRIDRRRAGRGPGRPAAGDACGKAPSTTSTWTRSLVESRPPGRGRTSSCTATSFAIRFSGSAIRSSIGSKSRRRSATTPTSVALTTPASCRTRSADDAEVVLKGKLEPDGFHVAPNGVMAKCPSKYEAQKKAGGTPGS